MPLQRTVHELSVVASLDDDGEACDGIVRRKDGCHGTNDIS